MFNLRVQKSRQLTAFQNYHYHISKIYTLSKKTDPYNVTNAVSNQICIKNEKQNIKIEVLFAL